MGSAKKAGRPLKERPAIDHVPNPDQAGDSKFARALGSNDFHTRDKGVKALTLWLQRQNTIAENALMKIWQGVFYCFWHSDKAHVQEDLAERLASIFAQLNDEVAEGYFKAFLATMNREWARIDRLRLDKFMMMVRKFLGQLFTRMAEQKWEKEYVARYMKLLHKVAFGALDALAPVGFGLHVADVFLPELLRVSAATASPVPSKRGMTLLKPFVSILAATQQPALVARVRSSIFNAVANELSKPSEGAPLKALDAQALSTALLTAGAAGEVRHKNRAALYELSQRFDNVAKKRKRVEGAPDEVPDSSAKRQKASAAAETPRKRAKVKGSFVLLPTPAAEVATADDASASNGVAASKVSSKTPSKKGGKARQETPRGERELAQPETLTENKKNGEAVMGKQQVREEVLAENNGTQAGPASGKKNKKKRKSLPAAVDGDGAAGLDSAMAAMPHSAPPKAVAAAGSPDLAPARLIKPAGASRSTNGSSGISEGGGVGELEQAALASAIQAVSSARRKSIHFNLRKNMVHQIGQPLPPAELRTPPRARPQGSALKKVSSLPVPKPDVLEPRRLSFGSAKRVKASDFI